MVQGEDQIEESFGNFAAFGPPEIRGTKQVALPILCLSVLSPRPSHHFHHSISLVQTRFA